MGPEITETIGSILFLEPAIPKRAEALLNEICYSFEKLTSLEDLYTSVSFQLTQNFTNIDPTETNFIFTHLELWQHFLLSESHEVEYLVSLQIIICLIESSILNRQQFGSQNELKNIILSRSKKEKDTNLKYLFTELLSNVLSVNANYSDIEFMLHDDECNWQLVQNSLKRVADISSASHLLIHNTYISLALGICSDSFTIDAWIEFVNTTSNRIMTLGTSFFIELKDSYLCLSNDEYIFAFFDSFEFEIGIVYYISINVFPNQITLCVNGQKMQTIPVVSIPLEHEAKVLELGSMRSSLKIFKLKVRKGGSFPKGIGLNLDEIFLMEKVEDEDLLLEFDVDTFLNNCQRDEQNFLVKDVSNFCEEGLCIYNKSSDIYGIFQSLNVLQFFLDRMLKCTDNRDLDKMVESILLLLAHPNLRAEFEKIKGYSILSCLLSSKVKKGYCLKKDDIDKLLDLAGKKFYRIDSFSLLSDETAFRIVLNLSLFKFDPNILSYIFESLQVVFSSRSNFQNRLEDLLDLQRYLAFQIHVHLETDSTNSVLNAVRNPLKKLLVSLLSQNLFNGGLIFILQFTYLTSMIGKFSLAKILLQSANVTLEKVVMQKKNKSPSNLPKKLHLKALFVVLEALGNDFESQKITLSVLFQFLSFDHEYLEAIIHGTGYKILFGILSNHLAGLESLVVYLIQNEEPPEYEVAPKKNKSWLLMDKKIAHLANLLTIQLLDWSVKNDIQFPSNNISHIILKYVNLMSIALSQDPFLPIFTSDKPHLLTSIIKLIATLMQPQNGDIYLNCSNELCILLGKLIVNGLKTDTHGTFTSFLNTLFDGNSIKNRCFSSFLMLRISPDMFSVIKDNNCINDSPVTPRKIFLRNVIFYVNLHKAIFKLKVYSIQSLLALHTFILYLKDTFNRNDQKLEIKDNQLRIIHEFHLKILKHLCLSLTYCSSTHRWYTQEFLESILYYQEIMFIRKDVWMDLSNESVANILELLIFLLRSKPYGEESTTALAAFRTICLLCEDELRVIGRYLSNNPTECHNLLQSCIALDDDSILKKLNSDSTPNVIKARISPIDSRNQESELIYVNGLEKDSTFTDFFSILIKEVIDIQNSELKDFMNVYRFFKRDNVALAQQMLFAEERRVSDFIIDEERHLSLSLDSIDEIKRNLATHDYLSRNINNLEWTLDLKEDNNRIRRRLLPYFIRDYETGIFSTSELKLYEAKCNESVSSRKSNRTSSFIDIMNTSGEFDLLNERKMDSNRLILHILNENDVIKTIWNGTKISGLMIQEGILILGVKYLYFVPGYYFDNDEKKVIGIKYVPASIRDTTIELITNLSNEPKQNYPEKPSFSHDPIFWDLNSFLNVTKRPFLLRDVALELYFNTNENAMFSFKTQGLRDNIYGKLEKLRSANKRGTIWDSILENVNLRSVNVGLRNGISETSLTDRFTNVLSGITKPNSNLEVTNLWISGKISNFDYLMAINTLAGRTFNDLTQYPVFPWVIKDYESSHLNLDNQLSFRDLSKPMGAQSFKRMQQFKERFEAIKSLNDNATTPFHYGTHYSSAMIVSSYLMRLQPYADSYRLLQGRQWGPPDRLFNSISRAWKQASEENTTDVRELIPEFFYLPDFLENKNEYNFGRLQNGQNVSDVSLPPWAKGDPRLFVEINRQALESEYVSEHLHEWIDLIFGYKQRGKASVDAINVFNSLSYPGSVNLAEISNENERKAITGIIHNFGQTPLQIFDCPHPPKLKISKNLDFSLYLHSLRGNFELLKSDLQTIRCNEMDVLSDGFSITIGGKRISKAHASPIIFKKLIDDETYVTADVLGLIKLWKIKPRFSLNHCLSGHRSSIRDIKIIHQYNTLVSLDTTGTVLNWDLSNGLLLRNLCNEVSLFAVSETTGNTAVLRKNRLLVFDINGSIFSEMDICLEITAISFAAHNSDWVFSYHNEKDILLLASDQTLEIVTFCAQESEWKFLPSLTIKCDEITMIEKIYAETGSSNNYESFTIKILLYCSDGKVYQWKAA